MDTNDRITLQSTSILSDGYGLYARCVARDKDLSLGAKALYAYFISFAGNSFSCYPGRALMLKELGISVKTYTKHLNELKDRNYIKVHPNKNKGKFDNNVYEIILDKRDIKETQPIECENEVVKEKDPKEDNKKNKNIESETLSKMSKLYQSNIGVVNGLIGEWIIEMSEKIDADLFKRAIEICTDNGILNHGYLKGIVKKWLDANITTYEQLKAAELQSKTKKERGLTNNDGHESVSKSEVRESKTGAKSDNRKQDEARKKLEAMGIRNEYL